MKLSCYQNYWSSGSWPLAIDLANPFFSIQVKKGIRNRSYSHKTDNNILSWFCLRAMLPFHNILQRGLDHLGILQNITSIHYVNNLILDKQEMASMLEAFEKIHVL